MRVKAGQFNDQAARQFTAADIRFTTKGESLYAVAMAWPGREAVIRALACGSPLVKGDVHEIRLLGHDAPLDFTRKVPNQMIEAAIYPTSWLSLQLVWVPVFKPAQLPPSTSFGFAVERDSNGCLLSSPPAPLTKENAAALAKSFAGVDPCMLNFKDPVVNTVMPQTRFADSQVGVRAKFKIVLTKFFACWCVGRA